MEFGGSYWLTRFYFQRTLGGIYFFAFLIALNQFRGLCGKNGIEPITLLFKHIKFWDAPSLFYFNQSDTFIIFLSILGLLISGAAIIGLTDAYGTVLSVVSWALLWVVYMSFVNAGQTFYGFGWEILLLETGFLAIFMGPSSSQPSALPIWLLRWLLFRLMFGAGIIKLRGDECWRDLTCMQYHYETMPLPGPTSWYFHQLPVWLNKFSVLFNHFIELIIPFFYFGPRVFRNTAGVLTVIFQIIIISSGNFSWLNHVTLVIAISCFDDSFLPQLTTWTKAMGVGSADMVLATVGGVPISVTYLVTALVVYLSFNPVRNMISQNQIMNTSFDPLHIVNTYGAFGSITRIRDEVIIEGAEFLSGPWKEYEFKGKPGAPRRRPPFVSPYHYKIDWQMWFAAMNSYRHHPWILNLVNKLLLGEKQVIELLGPNPFPANPPKFIRASLYEYHYSDPTDKEHWWKREYKSEYLPALSLDNNSFREILKSQEWLEN